MSEREKSALKDGLIKVFLLPDEVAVLYNTVLHLKAELLVLGERLDKDLPSLENEGMPSDFREAFHELSRLLQPLLETAHQALLVEAIGHFDEVGDEKGKTKLKERLDAWHERFSVLFQFMVTGDVLSTAQSLREGKKSR